jgi:hypothetical protein
MSLLSWDQPLFLSFGHRKALRRGMIFLEVLRSYRTVPPAPFLLSHSFSVFFNKMKSILLFSVLLLALDVIAVPTKVLHPRQNDALTNLLSGPKAPFAVKKLTPQYNPQATRELLIYGPFKLNPKKVFHLLSNSFFSSSLIPSL